MAIFDIDKDIYDLSRISLSALFYDLNDKKTDLQFIKEKNHIRFLEDYLSERTGVKATFAVVERKYINKDYLRDYSSYYSTCFEHYEKTGSRLHFFSTEGMTVTEFRSVFKSLIISGQASAKNYDDFWKQCYLGYVFIKPIPNLFMGFTLLKHFDYRTDKTIATTDRNFWGIKSYPIHIFGREISVRSLAFQEQDQNVAACATIAIWSMLQIAAEDYYVNLQSPGEITRNSGNIAYNGNRLIPNKGLSVLQMAQAITQNNLVTEVRERTDYKGDASFNLYVKKLIHAYSNLKIPSILLLNLAPPKKKPQKENPSLAVGEQEQCPNDAVLKLTTITEDEEDFEGHAVALSGDKMRPLKDIKRRNSLLSRKSKKFDPDNILWNADRIEKIYVHDDQWGPFSKMSFQGKEKVKSRNWRNIMGDGSIIRTEGLIVSLYPKIRISYDDIESKVILLNKFFVDQFKSGIVGDFVWDIQLYLSEDFKNTIVRNLCTNAEESYDENLRFKLMCKSLPKYIWVVTLQIDEEQLLHFVYDATGLSSGSIILSIFGTVTTFTSLFKKQLYLYKSVPDTRFTLIFDHNIGKYLDSIVE